MGVQAHVQSGQGAGAGAVQQGKSGWGQWSRELGTFPGGHREPGRCTSRGVPCSDLAFFI